MLFVAEHNHCNLCTSCEGFPPWLNIHVASLKRGYENSTFLQSRLRENSKGLARRSSTVTGKSRAADNYDRASPASSHFFPQINNRVQSGSVVPAGSKAPRGGVVMTMETPWGRSRPAARHLRAFAPVNYSSGPRLRRGV